MKILHFISRMLPASKRSVCPLCGQFADFLDFTENVRESGVCTSCGCTNRQRQMAYSIRYVFHMSRYGGINFSKDQVVYNLESNGPLHAALKGNNNYVCSEFFGNEYVSGEIVNGVRHEDLQNLSFGDDSFDLILSSDVLEHVPEPYEAHGEIFRVLRPGGRHIFTVPYDEAAFSDDVRARIIEGKPEYYAEKLYHGDPVRPEQGILVWTIFGSEMLRRLGNLGYRMDVLNLNRPLSGIIGAGAIVFVATKSVAS
jgi:SAM-dependent methyltransferase